jgi:predicted glycogen debranching enzyme
MSLGRTATLLVRPFLFSFYFCFEILYTAPMLTIPREICCDFEQVLSREWMVTNGLGGFASSTLTGANTRRYHGLLISALKPPAARTLTLAKLDEQVEVRGNVYRLGTNEYENGAIYPEGYLFLDQVQFDGTLPTFFYRSANFALTKTIWMEHGRNTTYIRYTLDPSSQPIRLTLLPLCTYRDFHDVIHNNPERHFDLQARAGLVSLSSRPVTGQYHLLTFPSANFIPLEMWYWRFKYRVEAERGLDSIEDLYLPGQWYVALSPGETFTVAATTEEPASVDRDPAAALERERVRQQTLAQNARSDFERQLFLAADQFIVMRQVDGNDLSTIIAGYPWFSDWGRDTMIALEGLTLVTGRHAEAKKILRAFSRHASQGMLPNRFPDEGVDVAPVEYNTVDATLWYFHALDRYLAVTGDDALLRELFPLLESIVDWHIRGTRYNIHMDSTDALIYAGAPGVQLTWMDAKAGDWVVTPRIGKPVEINALWYRALRLMAQWATQLGEQPLEYARLAVRVRESFTRYWYAAGGYLYDVLDTPQGEDDASLRPNQLFAIALADDLVSPEHARSVLRVVAQNLLTPVGLRSLSPHDPNYHSLYHGNQVARDATYHQGIVWGWLMGPYLDAYLKTFGDVASARLALDGFRTHLSEAGIGTISEIFEAEPPYRPVGCWAQAWSVAEVLRLNAKLSKA